LPRLIGVAAALALMLEARRLPPAEALACGAIDEVVPREELLSAARAWVLAHPRAMQPWDAPGFRAQGADGFDWARARDGLVARHGVIRHRSPVSTRCGKISRWRSTRAFPVESRRSRRFCRRRGAEPHARSHHATRAALLMDPIPVQRLRGAAARKSAMLLDTRASLPSGRRPQRRLGYPFAAMIAR
jgi:enoyl-CoA hydratase/carnithine racemase